MLVIHWCFVCFMHKTAYEMRSSDWSSDVCSSDLHEHAHAHDHGHHHGSDGALHFGHGAAGASVPGQSQARLVRIEQDILARNDAIAADNRRTFADAGVLALNLMSSPGAGRSEEHTSELQSLMRISYAGFCLTKKKEIRVKHINTH